MNRKNILENPNYRSELEVVMEESFNQSHRSPRSPDQANNLRELTIKNIESTLDTSKTRDSTHPIEKLARASKRYSKNSKRSFKSNYNTEYKSFSIPKLNIYEDLSTEIIANKPKSSLNTPKGQFLEVDVGLLDSHRSKSQDKLGKEVKDTPSKTDSGFHSPKDLKSSSQFTKSLQEKIGSLKIKQASFKDKNGSKNNYFLSNRFQPPERKTNRTNHTSNR